MAGYLQIHLYANPVMIIQQEQVNVLSLATLPASDPAGTADVDEGSTSRYHARIRSKQIFQTKLFLTTAGIVMIKELIPGTDTWRVQMRDTTSGIMG